MQSVQRHAAGRVRELTLCVLLEQRRSCAVLVVQCFVFSEYRYRSSNHYPRGWRCELQFLVQHTNCCYVNDYYTTL
jgi:hypothetical protein